MEDEARLKTNRICYQEARNKLPLRLKMVMGYVLFEMTTCNVVVDVESVCLRYSRFTPPPTAPPRTMSASSPCPPLRVFDRRTPRTIALDCMLI